ncbi:RNA polymerase factor sigma-54 [bacterium]|nr:RNA polymerase factor sigma-54 [bacterium]
MTQDLRLTQKLTQSLVITPQLQLAIKMLQLTRLELTETVQQEMLENPFLEEIDEAEEARAVNDSLPDSIAENEAPAEEIPTTSTVKEIDWRKYIEQQATYDYQGGSYEDEEREEIESPLSRGETLADHLLWQLQMSDLEEPLRSIAGQIVNELSDDGYLRRPLEEIAAAQAASEDDVEEALLAIQEFDPPGVGARDLRECLLIQLRLAGNENLALRRVVENHLPDLEKRNYKAIVGALRISMDELGDMIQQIGRLEPRPGRPFGGHPAQIITPDVYVLKIADEYVIVLNDDGMPRLRISSYYKNLLTNGDGRARGKDREYVQERLRSAAWMIRSIHQRQRTLYKVAQSIVKFQREFFDKGVKHLAPLILRDVAEDIGMHESTISRATTNKYMHTPHGMHELKYFFNSGIDATGGDQVASEAVKSHIETLIQEEDDKKPFSDQEIVELLRRRHGISIARRTVTKYREMMHIPSSTKRRNAF